jgi:hypothetical protein
VAYQEYRCVYGEDVETALRFLFNAMSSKSPELGDEANPFQGIPAALSLDNGPVAKSAVFKRVMESLGIEMLPHMPAGSDGRRTTARAKACVSYYAPFVWLTVVGTRCGAPWLPGLALAIV